MNFATAIDCLPYGTQRVTVGACRRRKTLAHSLLLFAMLAAGSARSFAFESLPLHEAAAQGKVSVRVTSLGGSTGDAILLTVKRLRPQPLQVTLAPGTVLRSGQASVQNMAAAKIRGKPMAGNRLEPMSDFYLDNDEEQTLVVRAYCLDFDKDNPATGDTFTIQGPDLNMARLLRLARESGEDTNTTQAAVWIIKDSVTDESLKAKFPINNQQLTAARALVQRTTAASDALAQLPRADSGPPAEKMFSIAGRLVDRADNPVGGQIVYAMRMKGTEISVSTRHTEKGIEVLDTPLAITDQTGVFTFRLTRAQISMRDGQQLGLALIDSTGIRPLHDREGDTVLVRYNADGGSVMIPVAIVQ